MPCQLYVEQRVAGWLRSSYHHQQHGDYGYIELDADLDLRQRTDRHAAVEWACNPERRQRVGYQRELQRQYSIRRELCRNGIQRDLEQHDQFATHLVCGERRGVPVA